MPEALFLGVGLYEGYVLLGAAGQAQVVQGHVVDREDRGRGAELGAHVADGCTVGQRHGGHAFAVELNELADDAVLAQHFGDGQHNVGGGGAGGDFTGQLEADNARDQHGDGLAEHCCLGLDAADAPAEHAQAVDHGGVGVGADAGVGVGAQHAVHFTRHDGAGQVLDVDLVHNAHSRGNDLEVIKCRLAPAEELVPLAVALVLDLHVALQGAGVTEGIDLDRVVNDHFRRRQRVHALGVAAEVGYGLAHGCQVHNAGDTGEVLHDHPGGGELDFGAGLCFCIPLRQGTYVVGSDVRTVFGAEQVLQQDLEAERKALGAFDGIQPENFIFGTVDV